MNASAQAPEHQRTFVRLSHQQDARLREGNDDVAGDPVGASRLEPERDAILANDLIGVRIFWNDERIL